MAATAVAQPRRRPARAPARRARPQLRVLRTATAISDAADSRLIVRLTRSQAWIAIVGALLIGIVALNVYSLGMGSVVSSTAERAADLERENSLLREQIGKLRKNGEIERFAAKLGLGQPASEELIRVAAGKGDAKRAAARLLGTSAAPITTGTAVAAVVDPATTDPALSDETIAAEATVATDATTDPAAEATATDPAAAPVTTVATGTTESETPTDPAATDPASTAAAGGIAP